MLYSCALIAIFSCSKTYSVCAFVRLATHTRIRDCVSSRGIKLEYSEAIGSAEGVSSRGLIKLKRGLSVADKFSVLVHEAAHEVLHRERDS